MLTAKQVAEQLGVSARFVYAIDAAKLPRYRFGGSVRFGQADVDGYKAACRVAPHPTSHLRVGGDAAASRGESELEAYFRLHGIQPRSDPRHRKTAC